jgi:hypothetical protein
MSPGVGWNGICSFQVSATGYMSLLKVILNGKTMILVIQGIYYILTGLWPLLHLHSFMLVTGEKTDTWLVKMVALLSVAIGLALVYRPVSTQRLLAIGAAVSFAAIDIFYASKGIISAIYLADALIQIIFIVFIVIKKWRVIGQ